MLGIAGHFFLNIHQSTVVVLTSRMVLLLSFMILFVLSQSGEPTKSSWKNTALMLVSSFSTICINLALMKQLVNLLFLGSAIG